MEFVTVVRNGLLNEINNHTHTQFDNNVLINGWLTVDNSTTIKGAVTVDKWLTTKSGVDLGGNTTIAGDLSVKGTNILSKINDVQDELNNHTHTSFRNDLTVGGRIITERRLRLTDGTDKKYVELVNQNGGNLNAILFSPNNTEEKVITLLSADGNTSLPGHLTVKGTNILSKITELENILKNHYDALLILCQKHGMVDSNTSDGSNVTPK